MTPTPVRAALADVAVLGPFFAASAGPGETGDPTWRSWRTLYDDPTALAARIELVAGVLGTGDRRVAASIAFQGLAARLVSPVLALAAVHGLVPAWTPESLHWRPVASGPWPLWESAPRAHRPPVEQLPGMVAEVLVGPHLAALAGATRSAQPVSARVLWGNAASAVVTAGRMVALARPGAGRGAAAVVGALLRSGPLVGSGELGSDWAFRRRSCCLYYRVPNGGVCGDCVLGAGR